MKTRTRFVGYTARDGSLRQPRRDATGEPVKEWIMHCEVCGRVFFARSTAALYCTNACRQKAYRVRCKRRRVEREIRNRFDRLGNTLRQLGLAL
jgi:ferredoxin